MASYAAVINSSLGAVARYASLDRWQVEIAREFAGHHFVAIKAGQIFLVRVMIESAKCHPPVGGRDLLDHGSRIVSRGFRHVMACRATGEWRPEAAGNSSLHVREEYGAFEVLTGFIKLFDAQPFSTDVFIELIPPRDSLMASAILFVLDIEAAQERTHVGRIAMRQIHPGLVFFSGCVRIELEGMAFGTMLLVGDRPLVFAPAVALVAVITFQSSRDLARPQVDLVIEFERVFIADAIPNLPELRVIGMKRGDHFGIAVFRAGARLNLWLAAGLEGWKGVRILLQSHFPRCGHEFSGAVA